MKRERKRNICNKQECRLGKKIIKKLDDGKKETNSLREGKFGKERKKNERQSYLFSNRARPLQTLKKKKKKRKQSKLST